MPFLNVCFNACECILQCIHKCQYEYKHKCIQIYTHTDISSPWAGHLPLQLKSGPLTFILCGESPSLRHSPVMSAIRGTQFPRSKNSKWLTYAACCNAHNVPRWHPFNLPKSTNWSSFRSWPDNRSDGPYLDRTAELDLCGRTGLITLSTSTWQAWQRKASISCVTSQPVPVQWLHGGPAALVWPGCCFPWIIQLTSLLSPPPLHYLTV